MAEALIVERDGPVVTLTINRPESRNPLGEAEDAELYPRAAAAINADRSIKVAILTGAGPAFSAGGNLRAMRERVQGPGEPSTDIRERYRQGIHRMVRAIWGIDVPLIAAVNGPAIGLGNDVACLADMRIAADNAIFGATFLKIGLVPGDGGAWILPRVIGMARAAELFYTASTIDAPTALEWGLVNKVVPAGELMTEARALAARICEQPGDVLRMTKRLLRDGQANSFDITMELSAAMQAIAHHTQAHKDAVEAFFTKAKR